MSADPARAALDERILAWMREPWPPPGRPGDDARFEALARELFAFQFEHCEPYARFCRGRGVTPATWGGWRAIPPVPAGAFKELALHTFPTERTRHVFRTSGTSSGGRGELRLDTLELYEASLLPSFDHFVLAGLGPGSGRRSRILVLAPSPAELPDSSLSHMFGVVLERRGDPGSGFFVRGERLLVERVALALEGAVAEGAPVVLCGTAFAFVHLLEALAEAGRTLQLPAGSRVMETGGFKGRARERSRDALHAEIAARLGVPTRCLVNQYGMTELGSQFHDSVLAEPGAPRRKLGPPWTRMRIVDPESAADSAPGEPGLIVLYDLANSGSILAVQTADLGRAVPPDGFEVQGREPGAEARGCSIALDEMLSGPAA